MKTTPTLPSYLLLIALASALPAAAQDEGTWTVEGRGPDGVPYRGAIRLERAVEGFTYERATRDARGRGEAERGRGHATPLPAGRAWLDLTPGEVPGLLSRLVAEAPGGPGAPGRYYVEGDRALGARGGARERLRRLEAGETLNDVQLLVDAEAFARIRADLARARRSIEVQTFHWQDDATGRSVAELLKERARAGVRVRCLVDSLTLQNSLAVDGVDFTRGLDDELRAAGVEVILAHPLLEGLLATLTPWGDGEERGVLNHDHRKFFIIDDQVGFTGGMNITTDYERVWHDAMVRVEGPGAGAMRALFDDRWRAAGGVVPPAATGAPEAAVRLTGAPVQLVTSLPGVNQDIKPMYLRHIAGARGRVLVENPYVLDDDVIGALTARARDPRVRVVLIVPSDEHQDIPPVADAFGWIQNDLVRSGVQVFKYPGRMVHAKVAVFDDVVTVGSANLDAQSLRLAEANVLSRDAALARALTERIFVPDARVSERVRERRLGWWEKVTGGLFHVVRTLL